MATERFVTARHDGFTEYLQFDNDDETGHIVRVADVEPVIEANKRAQSDNPAGYGVTREWQHVARVPVMVQFEWIKRYGADPLAPGNEALLTRVLNDPEWRYLRTGGGIL